MRLARRPLRLVSCVGDEEDAGGGDAAVNDAGMGVDVVRVPRRHLRRSGSRRAST
jgi:hypothetical protein